MVTHPTLVELAIRGIEQLHNNSLILDGDHLLSLIFENIFLDG
jgi:hypothetical protein